MSPALIPLLLLVLPMGRTQPDIDLQTCVHNFDIHRDKIIRTQDSQAMGAKYLTEIDLGTRDECLRLCCETRHCDVFVFEERAAGSCYLFECGPPEDFKCKFTHHVNYSSAVLAVSRRVASDLESQIKLTKHEQDLTKLRKIDEVTSTVVPPPPLSTHQPKTKEMLPVEMVVKSTERKVEEARKCSRFQFECRSTSECIAIYNACDGIPQCADKSDEAPELGCPQPETTTIPARFIPLNPNNNNVASPVQQEVYRPPQAEPPHNPENGDFVRPRTNQRFDGIVNAQYGPVQAVQPNWALSQPYVDKNSRIFNHKESGLQVPEAGPELNRYNKYKGAMQYLQGQLQYEGPPPYAQKPPAYYDPYRPQPPPPPYPLETWQNVAESAPYGAYPKYEPAPPPSVGQKTPLTPKHEQEKMAHELKQSKQATEPPSATQTIKIEAHKAHYASFYKVDEQADGIAQTPSGAVLSLTLGLILTCILALLIGCRLRVRRRMRKNGKSYAHDADYLVNGMYL